MSFRLEIQAKVRQLGWNPRVATQQNIESSRQQLMVLLQGLHGVMNSSSVVQINSTLRLIREPLAIWDDIVYELVPGGLNLMLDEMEEIEASTRPIQIEHQIIPLPSNDNVGRGNMQN